MGKTKINNKGVTMKFYKDTGMTKKDYILSLEEMVKEQTQNGFTKAIKKELKKIKK